MRSVLIFACFFVVGAFIAFLQWSADNVAIRNKNACLERGGFPLSKGHRTYDYHCFKENPLLTP